MAACRNSGRSVLDVARGIPARLIKVNLIRPPLHAPSLCLPLQNGRGGAADARNSFYVSIPSVPQRVERLKQTGSGVPSGLGGREVHRKLEDHLPVPLQRGQCTLPAAHRRWLAYPLLSVLPSLSGRTPSNAEINHACNYWSSFECGQAGVDGPIRCSAFQLSNTSRVPNFCPRSAAADETEREEK